MIQYKDIVKYIFIPYTYILIIYSSINYFNFSINFETAMIRRYLTQYIIKKIVSKDASAVRLKLWFIREVYYTVVVI